jgi:hypothetical protein
MNSLRDESNDSSDDKMVVEVEAPEPALRARDPAEIRAKGTRQQMPLIRDPGPGEPPASRDPVDVLRMWPVSTRPTLGEPAAEPRATLRAPSPGPHLDEKVRLAHLALDLYRELEDIQCAALRAPPVARDHALVCHDPRCTARANALRGALIEACLLVQRLALMTPERTSGDEVDDRVRDLLALIDH